MSELLGIDYDVLALDLTESESRHRALVSDPTPPSAPPALPEPGAIARSPVESAPSTITPAPRPGHAAAAPTRRSEEHTSELQSLMRISYAVFCLKKKKHTTQTLPQ